MESSLYYKDSKIIQILFKLMHPFMDAIMESSLRRRFNDPVRTLRAAGIKSGQKVLEVGCGTGFFTIPASKMVGDEGCIYAIDVYLPTIKLIEKKVKDAYISNIKLSNADAMNSGLTSNNFDIILLFGVIPAPVLPLIRLLPEMHRLLKIEGILAVWTALPFWSPMSITRSNLFEYTGRENNVHCYHKVLN